MPAEIHCPKYSSANVILSKKHGAFVCRDYRAGPIVSSQEFSGIIIAEAHA